MALLRLCCLCALVVRAEEKKYLIPILLYGPNNQFSALLEGLVMAKLTGRTLVVPQSFARWYRDNASAPTVPFQSVFELEPFRAFADVAEVTPALRELYERKRQWSALASPVPKTRLRDAMALLDLPCCPSRKTRLASHSRSRVIVEAFERDALLKSATFVLVAPLFALDGERRLLLEAARARRRAPRIRALAQRAREHFFGGASVLAVHVRREATDLGCADDRRYVVCPDLTRGVKTRELVHLIRRATSGTTRVYLAHAGNGPPELQGERTALIDALSSAGLTVVSASLPRDMEAAVGPLLAEGESLSPFEVSLIEQELCATLDNFLPSARSTWSATVTLDRDARSLRVLRPMDANLPVVVLP